MLTANSLKLVALLVCVSVPASAQFNRFDFFSAVGTSDTSYAYDGLPASTRMCEFRRVLTSYTTDKIVRLRRASDNAELDIGRTAGGALNTAAATTHCAATNCFVKTCYDQSGNGLDYTQATAGNQPAFTFNCLRSYPCMTMPTASSALAGGSAAPASGVVSIGGIALKAGTTTACSALRQNGNNNRLNIGLTGVVWQLVGGTSGTINTPITFGAWGASIGVLNGVNSVLNVNGTEVTGTAVGNTTAGVATITVGTGTDACSSLGASFFDNTALTASQSSIIITNQRSWWGF